MSMTSIRFKGGSIAKVLCLFSCMLLGHCSGILSSSAMAGNAASQADEVYVWTDEQGNKHFGDQPP